MIGVAFGLCHAGAHGLAQAEPVQRGAWVCSW